MNYSSKLHSKSQWVKSILGRAEFSLTAGGLKKNHLLVLNYHSTPLKFMGEFKKQVDFLQKHCDIIRPQEISEALDSESVRAKVLFTFDDGLKNNAHALEELEKRGFCALLFVVPDFIQANNQKGYYMDAIRPIVNSHIDSVPQDFEPLSWDELRTLVSQGHSVGSHTMSHRLHSGMDMAQLSTEIVDSKQVLYEKLGSTIQDFCSPNDTVFSVSSHGAKLIQENYRSHYTTVPKINSKGFHPMTIGRRNVEVFWPFGQFLNAIGSWDQWRWRGRIRAVDDLFV